MNHETQSNQIDQKNVKTTGQAEKAFTYNILIPDFAVLVIGLTGGFATLLTVFS